MKKQIVFLWPLLFILSILGCKKDDDDTTTDMEPNLSVTTHSIQAISGVDTVSFKIYTNIEWSITYNDEWCKPLTLAGDSVAVIDIAVAQNTALESRSSEITVHYVLDSENEQEVITVTQEAEPLQVSLSPDRIDKIPDIGGTYEIKVSANQPFEIVNLDAYDWIDRISTYAMTDETVILEIQPNTDVNYRLAELVFKQREADVSDTLSLYQLGIGSLETDKQALLALYQATGGAQWTKSWDVSKPVEEWYGVTVEETVSGKRVTELRLSNNNLEGVLPAELTELDYLRMLWLDNNQLSGDIPQNISDCIYLEYLYLHNNSFTGIIPQNIGNLSRLNRLYLNDNQLEGEIPASISNMPYLYALGLNNNNLTGGLPESIGAMPSLQFLFVNGNRLTGVIPDTYKNNVYWLDWQPLVNIVPQQPGYGFTE